MSGTSAHVSHQLQQSNFDPAKSLPAEKMSIDRLYNIAVSHRKKKAIDLAEMAFREALEMDQNHVPSLLGLASLLQTRDPATSKALFGHATGIICGPPLLPGEGFNRARSVPKPLSNLGAFASSRRPGEDVLG
uniref:Uncharacterized protein n=1 Tax=Cryptomonas curvata TaxID=233186 RepID=A0A7S0M5P6_9CRYP